MIEELEQPALESNRSKSFAYNKATVELDEVKDQTDDFLNLPEARGRNDATGNE